MIRPHRSFKIVGGLLISDTIHLLGGSSLFADLEDSVRIIKKFRNGHSGLTASEIISVYPGVPAWSFAGFIRNFLMALLLPMRSS